MIKKNIVVFPGSFDPITLGHYDIVMRGIKLFDEIIIAVGVNTQKEYMFSLKNRVSFVENTFRNCPNVSVKTYEGLTVEFCKKVGSDLILRGLRNPADFEFEKAITHTNRTLSKVETIFLLTSVKTSFISSSIVRDVIKNGGDYSKIVPKGMVFDGF